MKRNQLSILFLGLLSLLAVACGGAGDPGFDGTGGDPDFGDAGGDPGFGGTGGGQGGEPVEPPPVAPFDNDSADDPAVDEFLSITNTREIVYTDQISAEAAAGSRRARQTRSPVFSSIHSAMPRMLTMYM